MAQYQTYASLGDLITANDFPESLRFLGDGLSSVLANIYYQNLILIRSADGASFSLEIELLLGQSAGVDIPGTGGFRLVFNPDPAPGSPLSILPLQFYFSLGILKYVNLFDPGSFSFTPQNIFNLVLKIFNINGTELLGTLATNLIGGADPLTTFATQANTQGAGIPLPLDPDPETAMVAIITALETNGLSLRQIIFEDYLLGLTADLEAFWGSITGLFDSFLHADLESEVKKLIVPYLYASVALSLGLEIPRSVLLPMKPDGSGGYEVEEDENIKTMLIFDAGQVYFDSREGRIGFDDNIQLNFRPPHDKAQIGNTPLTIHFENARYRMVRREGEGATSAYHNVISIDEVEIGLPSIFEGNSGNPAITGRNIVIDSETGFSGIIGIEGNGNLQYTFVNGLTIELVSFDITFFEGSVTGSSVHGTLTIPSFQYNPLNIEITIEDGFLIKVMVPSTSGLPVINNDNLLITLNGLELGRIDTVWRIGFAAHFTMKRELPLLTKIFPKQFDIDHFLFTSDGATLEYDFHIEWASGAVIEGDNNSGITAIFPLHVDIGSGLFKVDNLKLVVTTEPGNTGMNFDALLQGVSFSVGPLLGSVDGFGASIQVKSAPTGGNIGPFKVDLDFIGPQGVGVQIKSNVISGGGYLYIGDGEYLGALSLSFKEKIGINAIGILTTKLPAGQSGYSLLVILTVDFGPIPLGMGFTLNGLGGILGLHRTMNPDVLRTGIRDNTLDYILFPQDIISNAKTIISNIGQAFPVQKGQFLMGPMAKIGWGTPTLLTIELGIIVEFPEPIRLAILGVIKALLPSKDNAIVKIQVNFLGIIDFTNKYLSFDASLYDSQILTFGLFGDMALRLYWGDKPAFLLSVGGFHPRFTPPPLNLPELRRLTLVLANQDNLKISVETYFAVT
ncbi:DUF6603 domain-containing protein, partial [Taibaiella koreensis]|uniref:DUF6603 domain-containing protein n=1 Tax=Taibaiella koreensis TaxID=1268548 RepID=UPI0019697342